MSLNLVESLAIKVVAAETKEEREEIEKQRRNTSLDDVALCMSLSHTLKLVVLSPTM